MFLEEIFTGSSLILGNIMWPWLDFQYRPLLGWVIVAGLAIKFFFVFRITGFTAIKCFMANGVMNAFSIGLGLIFLPYIEIVWVDSPLQDLAFHIGHQIYGHLSLAATFFFVVGMFALVESAVLGFFFRARIDWSAVEWLFAANLMTVGLAFLSFAL